jgi:tRNA uridine 5-carbamoylmethylation protein Kti12
VLIVITGPIASGKSTIAGALARELERRGATAAVIDLDLVYEMLSRGPKDNDIYWRLARRAAAALADSLLEDGVSIVIAEGEFLTAEHREEILNDVNRAEKAKVVTLRTSFEVALRRAQGDPTRSVSRDPRFLREHYDAAYLALQRAPATDLVLDTESLGPEEAARTIAASFRTSS